MNEHKSQAELLDLYLEALAHDPQALVPPGLDEKMAAFALQLMEVERIDVQTFATQRRVWEKMMGVAQKSSPSVSSNGRTHSSLRPPNMEDMMNNTSVYDYAPRINRPLNRRRVNFSLAAAALIVVLFAAVILFAVLSPRGEDRYGAEHIQASSTERPLQQTTTTRAIDQTPLSTAQMTASAIVGNATATAQAVLPSPTPLSQQMTATAIIAGATQTAQKIHAHQQTATTIIGNATATAQAALPSPTPFDNSAGSFPSSTPMPQQLTATAIIGNATATAQAMMANATPQPTVSIPSDFTLPPYQSALIPLKVGASVEGSVTSNQPIYYYVIQGKAGDYLTITVNASDQVSTRHYFTQDLPLSEPNSDDSGPTGEAGVQPKSLIYVPVDSVIIFSVQNETVGSSITYSIELTKLDVPQLTYGETFTSIYDPSNPNVVTGIICDFVGQRGDIIDIVVESERADWILSLTKLGDGGLLAFDDDSGAGLNPEIGSFQLPADGTYRIAINLIVHQLPLGEVNITVLKHEPIILVPDEIGTISLSPKDPAGVLSFEGQAGQTVELSVEYIQNTSTTLTRFSIEQNGSLLDQISVIGGAYSEVSSELASPSQRFVREIIIPADGTVNIFVNVDVATIEREAGIVSYSLLSQIYVTLQYQ